MRWKADVTFALDLAERLEKARTELLEQEAKTAASISKNPYPKKDRPWYPLQKRRHYVNFLASALGEFHVPVGAPILCTMVKNDASLDLKGNTLQRRKAVWALMNMGDNLNGFAKMPDATEAIGPRHAQGRSRQGKHTARARLGADRAALSRSCVGADRGGDRQGR